MKYSIFISNTKHSKPTQSQALRTSIEHKYQFINIHKATNNAIKSMKNIVSEW